MADFSHVHHSSRVIIRDFLGEPAYPAYSLKVLAEKLLRSATAKGHLEHIQRIDLQKFDPDDLEDRTPRALCVDFTPTFEDRYNRISDWSFEISPEELALRTGRIGELTTRQNEIKAKDEDDRSDAEKQELLDLDDQIFEMQTTSPGFLEAIPDGFGDGASALYYPLNEPWVPTRRKSKFYLDSDTPWSARLYFFKPNEEQSDWEFSLQWAGYRLTFRIDSVEFVAFKDGLSSADIQSLEAQLNELLDRGRITREDTLFKVQQKAAIDGIKSAAKAAGRGPAKLTDAEKTAIKALEKTIDDRWEEKRRRSGSEDDAIADKRKQLYEDRAAVDLGQKFETFFNQPFTISILPQKRGYITLKLEGAAFWSYESKRITITRKSGVLWKKTKLEIHTLGGAYKWQTGYPEPDDVGRGRIGPVDPGFDATGKPFEVTGHWDRATGTNIDFLFEPIEDAPTVKVGGVDQVRQWEIIFTMRPSAVPASSDLLLSARRINFLYDALLFIPSGERTGGDGIIWDSQQHLTEGGSSLVSDIRPQWDKDGAMTCTVTLRNIKGELSSEEQPFPPELNGRLVDLYVDETSNGATPYLARGIIFQPQRGDMAGAGASPDELPGSSVEFIALDRLALLSETIQARPVGDGMDMAAHTKDVIRCYGDKEIELRGVPDLLGIKLEGAAPGQEPLNQPSRGTSGAGYLRDLFWSQGLQGASPLELRWSADGNSYGNGGFWSLSAQSATIEIIDSASAEFQSANYNSRFWLRDAIDLPDDESELWNVFPVEGARDPKTKQTISKTYTVWESLRVEGDLRHIGRPKVFQVTRVPTLVTEDACIKAGAALAKLKCRGTKFRHIKTGFFRQLRPGKKIRADGLKVELVRALGASMKDDEMEWLALRLE